MSGPMDPERLARIRMVSTSGIVLTLDENGHADLAELLADRDHWEARAEAIWSTNTERLTPGMLAEQMRLDGMWQQLVREKYEAHAVAKRWEAECKRLESLRAKIALTLLAQCEETNHVKAELRRVRVQAETVYAANERLALLVAERPS